MSSKSLAQAMPEGQAQQALAHTPESLVELAGRSWLDKSCSDRLVATLLEVAASMAHASGHKILAAGLSDASDSARRGFTRAGLWTAGQALRATSSTVVGWAPASDLVTPSLDPEEQLLSTTVDTEQRIQVRLQYTDGPTNLGGQHHDERFSLTLGEALGVLATPASGVRALRLKAALCGAKAIVRDLVALRDKYRPEALVLCTRLTKLAPLSPATWDGGWGWQAAKVAEALTAALAPGARTTPQELGRAVLAARKLVNTTRSGLAKRAAYLARRLMQAGSEDSPATGLAARQAVAAWYHKQVRENRSWTLPLPGCKLLMVSPDPIRYIVPGAFDYPTLREQRGVEQLDFFFYVERKLALAETTKVRKVDWLWDLARGRAREHSASVGFRDMWTEYVALSEGEQKKLPSAEMAPTGLASEEHEHDAHVRCWQIAQWALRPVEISTPDPIRFQIRLVETRDFVSRASGTEQVGKVLVRAVCGACHKLMPRSVEMKVSHVLRTGGSVRCPHCAARNAVKV